MEKSKPVTRKAILRQMMDLACRPVNDAVRLAYLDGERELDRLDLTALTEFKRNANGTVEIKLTDRVSVLETLLNLLDAGKEDQAAAFFRALEAPDPSGPEISRR